MATKNLPPTPDTPRALTANRLDDGLVVFLAADGAWSRRLDDARLADDGEAEAALATAGEKAVAECRVVGPYLMEIDAANGRKRPLRLRERVRAYGPTVLAGAG